MAYVALAYVALAHIVAAVIVHSDAQLPRRELAAVRAHGEVARRVHRDRAELAINRQCDRGHLQGTGLRVRRVVVHR